MTPFLFSTKLNNSHILLVFLQIHLLFARLALAEVPDSLSLLDENLLRNLDQKCVRSLDGKSKYQALHCVKNEFFS